MTNFTILPSPQSVAQTAAQMAVDTLAEALRGNAAATWVLAGGTAPMAAYHELAHNYRDRLDWQKVSVALGDERYVPADSPDATWRGIDTALLTPLEIPLNKQLKPFVGDSAEVMAADYSTQLTDWNGPETQISKIDLMWLGMGEDGHTLSLFPGFAELNITDKLVVPVHHSPKPPPDRITFTRAALAGVASAVILTVGESKADAIAAVAAGDKSLPVVQASDTIEAAGGSVVWLIDEAAASKIKH